jgi:glycosyltransferase involved in cell wall biosynthesis
MHQSPSVIITTFSWPQALDAVLLSLADQSDREFEVVVADDGSGPETAAVVDRWRAVFGTRLAHAWQPDEGFRLSRVRNLGALDARGDLLVFVDGDCILRPGFITALQRAARPGWFLAGKRVQLREQLTRAVLDEGLEIGRRTALGHLLKGRRQIEGWSDLLPLDRRRPWRPGLPDFAPHNQAFGFLTCVSRSDFEAVNGFDLRFVGWGDQDVDLAIRLGRLGLRCGFAGRQSTVLHLAHPSRMSVDRPTWWLLEETRRNGQVEAVLGLRELVEELDCASSTPLRSREGS